MEKNTQGKAPCRPSREAREEIGFQAHRLHILCKRLVDQQAFGDLAEKPTKTQTWVINYLYENRGQDIFQRDIQEQFAVRRSTVTGILQLMEKNGWITREAVGEDARLKKILLTPQAIELHERVEESIRKTEEQLSQGLSPEEKAEFSRLCDKICRNAEGAVD